jgi:predicted double-glycine peptidase
MSDTIEQGISARKNLEATLIAKAIKDDGFRAQLLADPRGALADAVGSDLPGDVTVKVLEETATSIYVVLPAAQSGSRELSDDELQPVAGGVLITGHTDFIICCN